jgi:hypothetical protein
MFENGWNWLKVVDFCQNWAVEVSDGRFQLNASGIVRRYELTLENVKKIGKTDKKNG